MKRKDDFEDNDIVADTEETDRGDVDIEDIETQEGDKVKKLKQELKRCQQEKQEYLEALQETKADFLNSKKRLQEQLSRDTERATNVFIEKLLPLCDSFDNAMSDQQAWEQFDNSWRSGIEAILSQLNSILKAYDVEKIGTVGEPFDPSRHEAISVRDDESYDSDTVIEILQSGYVRNNEVIRPAKVIISS